MTSKLIVNSLAADTGVSTITFADQAKMGNAIFHSTGFTIGDSFLHSTGVNITNINATGVITATKFVGEVSVGSSITFEDNEKAYFGTGTDFSIYHDGSASYLDETGTGGLIAKTNTAFQVFNSAGSQPALTVTPGGAVELYHNTTKVLETKGYGIDIAGGFIQTGNSIINDNGKLQFGNSQDLQIFHSAGAASHINATGLLNIDGTTGVRLEYNNSTRVDCTSSGVSLVGDVDIAQNLVHTGDTDTKLSFYNDVITLDTAGIERFRIYNDGVVAIGQSSKSSTVGAGNLDIQGNGTSCIIEMGNPFPTFSGGIVPEFRITATNSSHTVDFESVWGGDNLLHKHLAFSGGSTIFYKGTNNDEIARFNSNKFGVGTASPGQLIHTHSGGSSGGLMIQSNGSTNYIAAIQTANNFANGSTAGGLVIRSGNGIEFSGNDGSTVQMRLASSGDLTVSDGNLVVGTAGHGIDFSATSGTGTSELLDDYEEGSWTPTARNNGSFTSAVGRYVKIGQQVTVWGFIPTVTNNTSNNVLQCSGLPFTVTTSGMTEFVGSLMIRFVTTVSGVNGVSFNTYVASGRDFIEFFACRDDGNNYESVRHSDLHYTNSNGIRFCITYVAT